MGTIPLVTLVTVTRNPGELLQQTLQATAAQTLRLSQPENVEVLVVDGASTDGTPQWLTQNPSLVDRWISEPDDGIYNAMNKGTALARGRWIMFMNAGDWFENPRVLEDLHLDSEPDGVVYGGARVRHYDSRSGAQWEDIDPPLELSKLPGQMICSHQSVVVPRSLVLQYPFDGRFGLAADHHFLAQLAAGRVAFKKVSITVSSVAAGGASGANLYRTFLEKRRAVVTAGLVSPLVSWRIYGPKILLLPLKNLVKWFLPFSLARRIKRTFFLPKEPL